MYPYAKCMLMMLVILFATVACERERSLADAVVGTWKVYLSETEWGPMTIELTLEATGTATQIAYHSHDQEKVIDRSKDVYHLAGDQIRFDRLFGGHPIQVSIEKRQLVLSKDGTVMFRMNRE